MSKLRLLLLGTPHLERDGVSLKLPLRKITALLAYLALTGESHSRESLAGFFWPDRSEAQAHAYLRNTVWSLKKVLGEEMIETERYTIELMCGAGVWIDVDQFKQLLTTPQTHGHPHNEVCSICLPALNEAAALYRGDFMAEFNLPDSPEFEDWKFFQAERLRHDFAGILELLVKHYRDAMVYEQAILYARRWLSLDPLQEQVHQQLMQLYDLSGQYSAALRQYQACVRILDKELGEPPSAETMAIYQAIRANRKTL